MFNIIFIHILRLVSDIKSMLVNHELVGIRYEYVINMVLLNYINTVFPDVKDGLVSKVHPILIYYIL